MNQIIEMKQVSFAYEKTLVLKQADFSIRQGDFAAIVGSNGAGKSTLLKLILNELPAASGKVCLFGEEISRFKHWDRVGYLPQSIRNTSFPATAEEIVATNLFSQLGLLRFPKKQHKEMVREALRTVKMENYAGRLIGTLSGGQRQRVLLARVLVNHPRILLLDEPTVGVDEAAVRSLYELLAALNRNHAMAVVMVTHDLHGALPYANRILRVSGGSIIEEGQKHASNF